jgi:uncharacterized protein YggT (Ycf19 family)
MNDEKPTGRESSRVARRAVSAPDVERDVTERVVGRPRLRATPVDTRRISSVAGEIGVAEGNDAHRAEPAPEYGWNVTGRMEALDYAFGAVYLLMTARLLLALVSADATAGVVRFINALTDPLYAPFRALLGVPAADEGHMLALPILIALVGYMLVHASISALLRVTRQRVPLA